MIGYSKACCPLIVNNGGQDSLIAITEQEKKNKTMTSLLLKTICRMKRENKEDHGKY